jgi:hypothetical protein
MKKPIYYPDFTLSDRHCWSGVRRKLRISLSLRTVASHEAKSRGSAFRNILGNKPAQHVGCGRWLLASAVEHQRRKRMGKPGHIAVLLLAAGLAGCSGGGYPMFDPDNATSFTSTGKQAEWLKGGGQKSASDGSGSDATGATSAPSDRTDTAALNSLFARAAEGKLNANPAAAGPVPSAKPDIKPIAVASAGDIAIPTGPPAGAGDKVTAEPRGRAYLFRGIAGLIYSRGMDRLEERIKHAGITASTQTYLMWRPVAD